MKNPTLQFRRVVAVVVLPMYLAACTSWQVQEVGPQQYVNEEQPETVLITMRNGAQVELKAPSVSGDSLTGSTTTDNVRSIALADIASVSARTTHAGKTVGLTLGLIAVAALIVGNLISAIIGAQTR